MNAERRGFKKLVNNVSTAFKIFELLPISAVPPLFQRIFDMIATQNKKTQAALDKMANENTKRHRIICQKMEELKGSLRHLQTRLNNGYGEEDRSGQSEQDSDQNCLTDATQVSCSGFGFLFVHWTVVFSPSTGHYGKMEMGSLTLSGRFTCI